MIWHSSIRKSATGYSNPEDFPCLTWEGRYGVYEIAKEMKNSDKNILRVFPYFPCAYGEEKQIFRPSVCFIRVCTLKMVALSYDTRKYMLREKLRKGIINPEPYLRGALEPYYQQPI